MDPKASIIPFLAFFTVFVMIDELLVRNIALICDAQISFAPGLTALTGETGAGKTALLSALKLLMGERADSSCVREGEAGALFKVDSIAVMLMPRALLLSGGFPPTAVAV